MICGSLRRGKEEAGDIDLVIMIEKNQRLLFNMRIQQDWNIPWSYARKPILCNGVQLEVHICMEENWGAMILYATGSGGYNAGLRLKAAEMGYKLNRYGLWKGDKRIAGVTESEIYFALQGPFVRPEDRK
jgi:DNA polymerase (family 10)